jgi:hypothetical protein
MVRPRWHDAAIATAIAGLLALGVWALWWEDVRAMLGLDPAPPAGAADPAAGRT